MQKNLHLLRRFFDGSEFLMENILEEILSLPEIKLLVNHWLTWTMLLLALIGVSIYLKKKSD